VAWPPSSLTIGKCTSFMRAAEVAEALGATILVDG
jgi:hypothetical protein